MKCALPCVLYGACNEWVLGLDSHGESGGSFPDLFVSMPCCLSCVQCLHTGVIFENEAQGFHHIYLFTLPVYAYICAYICVVVQVMVCTWRVEDNVRDSIFSFHHVGFRA